MIVLTRVDHRLLHGQMTFSWINGVQADCILVASDMVVNSDIWKTTLRLAKPEGCKLVMKTIVDSAKAINSGITDKYHLVVLVQTISEAKQLLDLCPQIVSLNLGNTKESNETHAIGKQVFVTEEEIQQLKELMNRGVEIEIRPLFNDPKVRFSDAVKAMHI